MLTIRWTPLALALPMLLAAACGGAQSHANTPDTVDTTASDTSASSAPAPAPADPAIQSSPASDTRASSAPPTPKSAPSSAGDKPTSDLEARIVSGSALPPSIKGGGGPSTDAPPSTAAKPTKKKGGKARKK